MIEFTEKTSGFRHAENVDFHINGCDVIVSNSFKSLDEVEIFRNRETGEIKVFADWIEVTAHVARDTVDATIRELESRWNFFIKAA